MYNIIIVEDEAILREGMAKKIKWAEIGYNLVGLCENGVEALELIEKQHVDVVLTDIHMPERGGLSMSVIIAEKYPHIKTIILTGYDVSKYVMISLRAKVWDFILKPITAAELTSTLQGLKTELDKERKITEERKRHEVLLSESRSLMRARFLKLLVYGELDDDEVTKKLDYFGIKLEGPNFAIARIEVELDDCREFFPEDSNAELLYFAINNICDEIITNAGLGYAYQNQNERTVILFSGGKNLETEAYKLCEKIRVFLEENLGIVVTIGLSKPFSDMKNSRAAYFQSIKALLHRIVSGCDRTILVSETKTNFNAINYTFFDFEKDIISAMHSNAHDQIEQVVESFIDALGKSDLTMNQCYHLSKRILFAIEKLFYELGIELDDLLKGLLDEGESLTTKVYQYKTLESLRRWLCDVCVLAANYLSSQRDGYSAGVIAKAKDYINRNYTNPKLTVGSICKYLFISVSYFSTMFKNATGETVVEYLTGLRVEKAKELLAKTRLKNYEVANKVGYSDPHYFSTLFKKYTGKTPTTYRNENNK